MIFHRESDGEPTRYKPEKEYAEINSPPYPAAGHERATSLKTRLTNWHDEIRLAVADGENRLCLVWEARQRQSLGAIRQPLDLSLLRREILVQPQLLTCKGGPSAKTVSQPWQCELQSGVRSQTKVMQNQHNPKLLLAREKLTRTFFSALPDSVYVISNIFVTPNRPAYEFWVAPKAQRSQQWGFVPKDVRYRLCSVFRCKADACLRSLLLTQGMPDGSQTRPLSFLGTFLGRSRSRRPLARGHGKPGTLPTQSS